MTGGARSGGLMDTLLNFNSVQCARSQKERARKGDAPSYFSRRAYRCHRNAGRPVKQASAAGRPRRDRLELPD